MQLSRLNSLAVILITTLWLIKRVIAASSNSPLIYTRLRFDQNYLPLMKNLQLKFPYDECKYQTTIVAHGNNNTTAKTQNITYYINSRLNLNNITEDDLILDALDQVYKTRLYQVYIQSYDRLDDRAISSDPNKVSIDECKRDLDYLMDKFQYMNNFRHNHIAGGSRGLNPELSTFFDSFASEEPGLLLGNNNWLGNWRQCSRRHIFDLDQKQLNQMLQQNNHSSSSRAKGKESSIKVTSFKGRFCIAAIRSPRWKQKVIQRADELTKKDYFKYPSQHHEYVNFFRIQVGICLPESCDSSAIDFRSQDLRKLTMHKLKEPFSSYELFDLYCLPDESSKLRQVDLSGTILIGACISWLTLIAFATCLDCYKLVDLSKAKDTEDRGIIEKVVFSMSLRENYRRITKKNNKTASETTPIRYEAKSSDLRFLDAVKVIIMPYIILAHVGMIGLQFSKHPIDFDSAPIFLFAIQSGSAFYVDWYFCITGFITTYGMFTKNRILKYSWSRWLYSIFHRYWRLAPSYIIVFWFCRSLYSLTSSGPLWDYGTTDSAGPRTLCQRESWLIPLTLTSNWHPLHRECVMPSWYISCDMQFYLVTPFLLILLAKSPFAGWLVTISLILGSILARFYIFMTDIHIEPLELLRPQRDLVMRHSWDLPEVYLRPQYRIPSYLVGVLFGHYTYMVKSGRWKSSLYERCSLASVTNKTSINGVIDCINGSGINNKCHKTRAQKDGVSWRLRMCAWIGLYMAISFKFSVLSLRNLLPSTLEFHAKLLAAILYSSAHALASISPCLMFMAIAFGYWRQVRKFMELPIFTYTSRVNYFVYLCQIDILIWLINSSVQPLDIDGQEQLKLFTYCLPWIYFGAFLATLLLSSPLGTLESEFLGVYFKDDDDDESGFADLTRNNITAEVFEVARPLEKIVLENGSAKMEKDSDVEGTVLMARQEGKAILEQRHEEATSGICKSTGTQFFTTIATSSNDEPPL